MQTDAIPAHAHVTRIGPTGISTMGKLPREPKPSAVEFLRGGNVRNMQNRNRELKQLDTSINLDLPGTGPVACEIDAKQLNRFLLAERRRNQGSPAAASPVRQLRLAGKAFCFQLRPSQLPRSSGFRHVAAIQPPDQRHIDPWHPLPTVSCPLR